MACKFHGHDMTYGADWGCYCELNVAQHKELCLDDEKCEQFFPSRFERKFVFTASENQSIEFLQNKFTKFLNESSEAMTRELRRYNVEAHEAKITVRFEIVP